MNKSTHLQTFDLESRINPLSLSLSEIESWKEQTTRANDGRIVSRVGQIGSFFRRLNRTMRAKRSVITAWQAVSVGCVAPRGASILIILIFHRYHRPRRSKPSRTTYQGVTRAIYRATFETN